mmetsp:Transcript_33486/g.105795  ORF Transcript_33486/g.105795 Transcript_33486/m.105795 type:complete len:268 (-) Transcript_33486:211-1014(-)
MNTSARRTLRPPFLSRSSISIASPRRKRPGSPEELHEGSTQRGESVDNMLKGRFEGRLRRSWKVRCATTLTPSYPVSYSVSNLNILSLQILDSPMRRVRFSTPAFLREARERRRKKRVQPALRSKEDEERTITRTWQRSGSGVGESGTFDAPIGGGKNRPWALCIETSLSSTAACGELHTPTWDEEDLERSAKDAKGLIDEQDLTPASSCESSVSSYGDATPPCVSSLEVNVAVRERLFTLPEGLGSRSSESYDGSTYDDFQDAKEV